MKQQPRIYYTETDKTLMWDRWQKGESQSSIARHFGRGHSSVQRILGETGGIRPAQKRRSRLALSKGPIVSALQKYDFMVLYPINPSDVGQIPVKHLHPVAPRTIRVMRNWRWI